MSCTYTNIKPLTFPYTVFRWQESRSEFSYILSYIIFYVILNLGRIQDTQARTCTHIHTQSCIELTCDLQNALRCFVEGSGVLQQISLR